jgi:hypothetical protein
MVNITAGSGLRAIFPEGMEGQIPTPGKINWEDPLKDGLFEIGVTFDRGPFAGGSAVYLANKTPEGEYIPLRNAGYRISDFERESMASGPVRDYLLNLEASIEQEKRRK